MASRRTVSRSHFGLASNHTMSVAQRNGSVPGGIRSESHGTLAVRLPCTYLAAGAAAHRRQQHDEAGRDAAVVAGLRYFMGLRVPAWAARSSGIPRPTTRSRRPRIVPRPATAPSPKGRGSHNTTTAYTMCQSGPRPPTRRLPPSLSHVTRFEAQRGRLMLPTSYGHLCMPFKSERTPFPVLNNPVPSLLLAECCSNAVA